MNSDQLLRKGELAKALCCGRTYVWGMTKAGFPMPGGRATRREAREWLNAHPDFKVPKGKREDGERL